MLATTISTLIAKWIESDSIYALKLSRRGLRISQGIDMSILESAQVRNILSTEFIAIKQSTSLGEITRLLQQSDLSDYPVIDDDQVLWGGEFSRRPFGDDARRSLFHAHRRRFDAGRSACGQGGRFAAGGAQCVHSERDSPSAGRRQYA